jgi:D-glycero-alpha-D-manno-heptose 1-phosphate guanylyltransferase
MAENERTSIAPHQAGKYPAIILAGGLGTRLRPVINDLPKPMAPVNGKPFLHYIFQYLERQAITEAIVSIGYKGETIQEYFGSKYLHIKIKYAIETEPLGTGGGIKKAFEYADGYAYVLNGDTLFNVDLEELRKLYFNARCDIALALKQLKNFDRYGTVELDSENRITGFAEKKFVNEGLINGGIYFFSPRLFDKIEISDKFSLEKEVLEKQANFLKFYGKVFDDYFIDIGIPEDYEKAQYDLS